MSITETLDFCGEAITVTKQVKAGSKEELAARQTQPAPAAAPAAAAPAAAAPAGVGDALAKAVATGSALQQQMTASAAAPVKFSSDLAFTGALPASSSAAATAAKPKPTGLAGLLASIDGKKKMSTMEKSRHDWGQWKETQDETTREQMAQYAKDGYLEKVAFLERTDARQAQVARSNRRRGMGLRGED